MNILEKIIETKRIEVAALKRATTISELEKSPLFLRKCFSLKENLLNSQSGIIAEFKRKSPSKGWINENADLAKITAGYETFGAAGISILTDNQYFGGCLDDLRSVRKNISIPILRKDFIIDIFQIYEAKAAGADVVLLIAAALSKTQTHELAKTAKTLGLEVLLEIHNSAELDFYNENVDLLGVNNRNLETFVTDINISVELAKLMPQYCVKISESGISSPETVKHLRSAGYKGFLMGENFMKHENPAEEFKKFIEWIER
ncbi:MAG: indole-3-glycerol phosphate synthase TrpC [Paludibacter sp.]|jgi:indole-3-glycerol phosphate synthase|nr:indole-3-glycerol phosphate synthase TrpC [Paludibacter sp.]